MSKFKLGDRVKHLCDVEGYKFRNCNTGTVIVLDGSMIGVEFDKPIGGHECSGGGSRLRDGKYGHCWWVGESHLEKLNEKSDECIVIYRKDREVIALDKTSGKKAVAKCSPEDTFDFKVGAKLAFERLMTTTKIVKQDKYQVGDKVKIVDKFTPDCCHNLNGLMDKYLGTVMTIKRINYNGSYKMVEDSVDHGNLGWAWNDHCIEGKVVEEGEHKKLEEPVEPFPDGCIIELTECENEIPKGTRGRVVGKCNRPGLRDCYSVDFGFEYETTHDCDVLPGSTGRWLSPKQMQRVK